MSKENTSSEIFFILGRGRSGTTLIRTILDAHPNVLVPPESPIILALWSKYRTITWTKKTLNVFYEDVINEPQLKRLWDIDFSNFKKELSEVSENASFQEVMKIVYRHYQSPFPKDDIQLLGDKNPIFSLHIEKLLQVFPKAKIIYVTRDYRDNILSQKRIHSTMVRTTAALAWHWREYIKKFIQAQKNHPNQILLISYESFSENPTPHLHRICDFIGLEFKKEMLNFHSNAKTFSGRLSQVLDMHQNLLNPVNTSRTNLWKDNMSSKDIQIADAICGAFGKKVGYTADDQPTRIPIAAWPSIVFVKTSMLFFATVERLPLNVRSSILNMVRTISPPTWKRLADKK